MERAHDRLEGRSAWRRNRHRLRLECRECEVICERVISPWDCLRSQCPCIYAYESDDTTYFGCLRKVFTPELDLGAFEGEGGRRRRGADPYGLIRISRMPWPQCRVTVEQAYESSFNGANCCNPTFFHHPSGPEEDRIRLTVKSPGEDGRLDGDRDGGADDGDRHGDGHPGAEAAGDDGSDGPGV